MGLSHHVLFSVSVVSLAMNCCSRKWASGPGKREAELSPPRQAEGKVQSLEWPGGREGEGGSVFLSDPERQWSEHRAAP